MYAGFPPSRSNTMRTVTDYDRSRYMTDHRGHLRRDELKQHFRKESRSLYSRRTYSPERSSSSSRYLIDENRKLRERIERLERHRARDMAVAVSTRIYRDSSMSSRRRHLEMDDALRKRRRETRGFSPEKKKRLSIVKDPHRKSSREMCRQFLRGRCKWGSECKYMHLQKPSDQSISSSGRWHCDICKINIRIKDKDPHLLGKKHAMKAYELGANKSAKGTLSSKRSHLHVVKRSGKAADEPCRQFAKGICSHGDSCKYKHSDQLEPVESVLKEKRRGLYYCTLCDTNVKTFHKEEHLQGKKHQSFLQAGGTNVRENCLDFLNGNCTRGEKCRYLHSREVCLNFQNGNCTRGEKCRYSHGREASHDRRASRKRIPCLDLLNGNCTYGEKCRYLHDTVGVDDRKGNSNSGEESHLSHPESEEDDLVGIDTDSAQQVGDDGIDVEGTQHLSGDRVDAEGTQQLAVDDSLVQEAEEKIQDEIILKTEEEPSNILDELLECDDENDGENQLSDAYV